MAAAAPPAAEASDAGRVSARAPARGQEAAPAAAARGAALGAPPGPDVLLVDAEPLQREALPRVATLTLTRFAAAAPRPRDVSLARIGQLWEFYLAARQLSGSHASGAGGVSGSRSEDSRQQGEAAGGGGGDAGAAELELDAPAAAAQGFAAFVQHMRRRAQGLAGEAGARGEGPAADGAGSREARLGAGGKPWLEETRALLALVARMQAHAERGEARGEGPEA